MYSPGTLWQKIKWQIDKIVDVVEYFFAERWLNKTFGEREYWGEYLDRILPDEDGE